MKEEVRKAPKIRFKGFKDDWEQRKLSDMAQVTMGQSPNGANYTKNPQDHILVQGNADMKNGRVRPRVWTTQVTKTAKKGDLILSVRAPVGDVGKTDYNVVLGRGVAGIKGNNFIYQSLLKMKEDGYWRILSTGSTFESINSNDIKNANILAPCNNEQVKIGGYCSEIDNLITLHQRKLDLLKVTKKSMLQKMFPKDGERVPEIRFAGFTDPWEQRKLEEMGDTFTGLSGKTKEDFGHGDAKFITYVNVFGNVISDPKGVESVEVDNKQNQVKYGDVFFTTSSETPEEVGMASVWIEKTENVYLNSFCFGYRPNVEIDIYYLAFMLRSQEIRKKFMVLAQGISRYNISKSKVMEMNVPVPELSEQQKIGTYFNNMDTIITLNQRELDLLKDLKKSMLQQMFI